VRITRFSHVLRDVLVIGLATAISFLAIEVFCQAGWHQSRYVYVIIDEGIPFSEVAERVEEAGLVRDPRLFLAIGRMAGIEHRAGAGRYRFERTSDMAAVLRTLYRGVSYRERVTIPGGLVLPSIAHILSRRAGVDSTLFMNYARDSTFVASLGVPSSDAEGYLFPETYDIEWAEAPDVIISRMVSAFFRAFNDSLRERAREIGLTVNETTTLASIIEKEAMLNSEKPRISAVFHNRLDRGMKLQADPTVRYALKRWRGRILYKHLDEPSPFNTYYIYGLPPHPICNPELSSIEAALYPAKGSKDLYFVATGDGHHTFTTRSSDHNRAKAEYKRYLRAQREAEAEKARQALDDEGDEGDEGLDEGDRSVEIPAAPGKEKPVEEATSSGTR
jgi:UPF0755 protein